MQLNRKIIYRLARKIMILVSLIQNVIMENLTDPFRQSVRFSSIRVFCSSFFVERRFQKNPTAVRLLSKES